MITNWIDFWWIFKRKSKPKHIHFIPDFVFYPVHACFMNLLFLRTKCVPKVYFVFDIVRKISQTIKKLKLKKNFYWDSIKNFLTNFISFSTLFVVYFEPFTSNNHSIPFERTAVYFSLFPAVVRNVSSLVFSNGRNSCGHEQTVWNKLTREISRKMNSNPFDLFNFVHSQIHITRINLR